MRPWSPGAPARRAGARGAGIDRPNSTGCVPGHQDLEPEGLPVGRALIGMKHLSFILALGLTSACAADDTDASQYAIDSDHSGVVDCHDLEHVQACVADPHHTG